uniref:Uncharacterized protein n=1 Tax=Anopheles stephensi TaxID=30069 RepID=A0A182YEP1_ANOST
MLSTIGELFGDHEVNDFIEYKTHVSDNKFWSTELDNVPFLDRSTVGSLLDLDDSPPTYDEFYTSKFMIPSAVQPTEVSGFSSIPSTTIPQGYDTVYCRKGILGPSGEEWIDIKMLSFCTSE